MRWLRIISIVLVAAVLQVSLMGALRLGGVVPNVALVLVVVISVWGLASEVVLAGVVLGLIMDISGGGSFGLATSSLVVIGLGLVALRQIGVDGDAWLVRIGLVLAASAVWWLIHMAALGFESLAGLTSWRILGVEVTLNVLILFFCSRRLLYGTRKV